MNSQTPLSEGNHIDRCLFDSGGHTADSSAILCHCEKNQPYFTLYAGSDHGIMNGATFEIYRTDISDEWGPFTTAIAETVEASISFLKPADQTIFTIYKDCHVWYASLGDSWQPVNQYPEAISKLEKDIQIFGKIEDTLGEAKCLQSLGDILQLRNEYSEASIKIEKAMQTFEDIGNTLRAAQCLQSLGDILQMTINTQKPLSSWRRLCRHLKTLVTLLE